MKMANYFRAKTYPRPKSCAWQSEILGTNSYICILFIASVFSPPYFDQFALSVILSSSIRSAVRHWSSENGGPARAECAGIYSVFKIHLFLLKIIDNSIKKADYYHRINGFRLFLW